MVDINWRTITIFLDWMIMLKRKIYDNIKKWKETKDKECLLVKGARQVSKTYLIRKFGENEYESFIEINFHKQEELKSIFDIYD